MKPHEIALQICVQTFTPVFLWGLPGVGKTVSVEALAEALQMMLFTIILSIREPTDQGGMPVVTEEGVVLHPAKWARDCANNGGGLVFFDEFNTSAPNTQSSALRVVHGRFAGDQELPQATAFVGAGNPPEKVTGVYQLTAAIANRWVHLDWPFDFDGWTTGMQSGWKPPQIVRVPDNWKDRIGSKRTLWSSAAKRLGRELVMSFPETRGEQGRAWPSPRTSERAADLMAAAEAVGFGSKTAVTRALVRGCVGEESAEMFFEWLTNLDLRDPEDYLSAPDSTPMPDRQDKRLVTLDTVVSAALKEHPDYVGRYYRAWQVVGRIAEKEVDVAVPAARVLSKHITMEMIQAMGVPPQLEQHFGEMFSSGDFSFEAAS
jgi:hypothetical protein